MDHHYKRGKSLNQAKFINGYPALYDLYRYDLVPPQPLFHTSSLHSN